MDWLNAHSQKLLCNTKMLRQPIGDAPYSIAAAFSKNHPNGNAAGVSLAVPNENR
ncbi:hypothetical protein [Sphingomonas sp. 1185]|uniref:hypothetical protein n=1 Tax=Sphingomonas sp. 1185 TaxID=3156411 RepID=UPI0033921B56